MTDVSVADSQAPENPIASLDTSEATEDAEGVAKGERKTGTLKGGHDAAAMARKRWEKARSRETDDQAQAAHDARAQVVVVRVPVQVGSVITSLATKAQKGGVQEARELRAYLSEYPVETDTDVSALERRHRQALLALCLDERVIEAMQDGSLDAFLESRPTPANAGTPAG